MRQKIREIVDASTKFGEKQGKGCGKVTGGGAIKNA